MIYADNAAVAEALDGLPAHKMHCSVLAEEAVKAALADYYTRRGEPVPPECVIDEGAPAPAILFEKSCQSDPQPEMVRTCVTSAR